MIGTVIDGKYRIEKKIGRGGFGTVYRATDLKLKRPVALKFLESVSPSESARARFQRESEALALLNHPHIVTIFDCGEHGDRPYLVMELIDGPTLHDIAAQALPDLGDVLGWASQVCVGMAFAHGRGFIHRDLTLKNIMLKSEIPGRPAVKILDFGLAKLADSAATTASIAMHGTPNYMSPEQVNGGRADLRSDIFGFGVGLYRLTCGEFPFVAEHPTAIMYQILTRSDFDFPPAVPVRLQQLILRCLEKNPDQRPQSFEEIAQELAAIAAVLDAPLRADTGTISVSGVQPVRTSRRNPYLNRVMIKSPADFFGREKEVNKIFARLDAPHPQSISIVGERRIGKSSLLNFVYNRTNRRKQMTHYENALFVYLDFQHDLDFNPEKFIDYLFTTFAYEIQDACAYRGKERSLDQLKSVIQQIMGLGKRIVILMDEFEVITNNKNFDADFFSFLRAMANSYKVAYVTSSCQEMQTLCHNQDISDSPFFNIFSNLPLKPFTREEALDLITVPSRREGLELTTYADRIIDLAGYRPMFLQMGCSAVFESMVSRERESPDWSEVESAYKDEAHPHYLALWDRLEGNERDALIRLARGEKTRREHLYLLDGLARQGFVEGDGGGARFCSTALRDFVRGRAAGEAGARAAPGRRAATLLRLFKRS